MSYCRLGLFYGIVDMTLRNDAKCKRRDVAKVCAFCGVRGCLEEGTPPSFKHGVLGSLPHPLSGTIWGFCAGQADLCVGFREVQSMAYLEDCSVQVYTPANLVIFKLIIKHPTETNSCFFFLLHCFLKACFKRHSIFLRLIE